MDKVLERFCLFLWAIITTAAISCFGLGVMITTINFGVHYMGQSQEMVMESHTLMLAGLVTMPPAFFTRYFGVKYLHFLEHDDSVSKDGDPGA